jgi:hypothetical protein
MIEFTCDSCGQGIRVPDRNAGRRARCKSCGHILLIPSSSQYDHQVAAAATTPLSQNELAQYVPTDEVSLTNSQRRLLRLGIIAAILLIPLLLAALILPGKFRQWSYDRAYARIEPPVKHVLQQARDDANSYRFSQADQRLTNAVDPIYDAGISESQVEELKGRIEALRREIQRDETEYRRKLAAGYVVKDGDLLSPEQQKALAAEEIERERREGAAQDESAKRQEQQQAVVQPSQNIAQAKPEPSNEPTEPDLSSPVWKKHIRGLVAFLEPLEKSLALMEQADGISYPDLVTCANTLRDRARSIYVPESDETMKSNSMKVQSLANQFAIAAGAWEVANEAAHTGPADPSYDLKVALTKEKIAMRDEYLNRAAQDGQRISTRIRELAARAGILLRPAPERKAAPTDTDILQAAKTWRNKQLASLPGQIKATSDKEMQVMNQMRRDGADGNSIREGRKAIQDERTELQRLQKALKDGDDSVVLAEYRKVIEAQAERQQEAAQLEQDRQQRAAQWEARVRRTHEIFGNVELTLCPDCIGPQLSAIGAGVNNGTRQIDGKQLPPDPNCRRCGGTGLVPAN